MEKSVLLSGASGFLGSVIQNTLCNEFGFIVTSLGRRRANIQKDITKSFGLPYHLEVATVIHVAGKAHSVPSNEAEEQEFYITNFEGTKNLCAALEKLDKTPKNFIFISSVAVYGVEKGVGITERYPTNGTSPYAHSKILAEHWLKEWGQKNAITISILRLPLLVGRNAPGNLGAMVQGIKTGRYLSIGRANAKKSMVWVNDVARAIPKIAGVEGVYNLTDGYHPTFGELEKSIANATNKRNPFKIPYWSAKLLAVGGDIIGRRFPLNSNKLKKITSTLTFDDTKATEKFGWRPTPVLHIINEIV